MRWLSVAAVACLAGTALAGAAQASQVTHLDTRALTLSSSDVIIGEVQSVRSRWNDAHTKIVTDVEVAVSRSFKGGAGSRLSFTQLGGTVGNLHVEVEGSPAFTPGENAVWFLWRDPNGHAQLNGLGQGKFEIHRDARSGQQLVQRSAAGLAVRDAHALKLVPGGQPAPGVPLEELVGEIESALKEGGR